MLKLTSLVTALSLVFLLSVAPATGQNRNVNTDLPISTWQAPAFWDASSAHRDPMDREKLQAARPAPEAASGTPLSNSLTFIAIVPCRLVDTRGASGETGAFGPPVMTAGQTRTIPVLSNTRCNIPSTAQAYSLNFTVIPPGQLSFLTAWPTGNPPIPSVSILNDFLGTVLANAAVVPGGASGSIDVYVTNLTDVVIDINGYYAPQISLANGTAAAPSLTFAGDSTSGLYSSAAGTVSVATGGTNRLTVASNGNVGIGTTTPGSMLDVAGDINFSNVIRYNTIPVLTVSGQQFNMGLGLSALNTAGTGTGNTAVGPNAMQNNTSGISNTALGYAALTANSTGSGNTALGNHALQTTTSGSLNTATGGGALYNNFGGSNTANGQGSLLFNTSGSFNTAAGQNALKNNTTGSSNTVLGYQAGANLVTGSSNIMIGNQGTAGDGGTIRMGDVQTKTFVAGIRGITTANNDAIPVMIDSAGQLGTVSSSRRFNDDIQDRGEASHDLLRLRPVTFRYKKAFSDGTKPIQYGLIAEEVAEVYPDLVARSADGQVETVKYQVLDSMLLNEVQRQQAEISSQKGQIRGLEQQNQHLQRRLARLEAALVSASGEPRLPE